MNSLRVQNYLSESHKSAHNELYFASATCSLQEVLLRHISESAAVVGCVGWLTSKAVVAALASRPDGSSFIVDKGYVAKTPKLRVLLGQIPHRATLHEPMWDTTALNVLKPVVPVLDSVRILGFKGCDGQASPLMHHKFAVLLNRVDGVLVPVGVLLGSFNFSDNADRSLEFLNLSRDPVVIQAFLNEFAALYLLLSEPLESEADVPKPQWRAYVNGFADAVRWCWNWSPALALPTELEDLEEMLESVSKTVRALKASPDTSAGDAYANSDWSALLVFAPGEGLSWSVEVNGMVVVAWDEDLQPECHDLDCAGVMVAADTPCEAVRAFLYELWCRDLLHSLDRK